MCESSCVSDSTGLVDVYADVPSHPAHALLLLLPSMLLPEKRKERRKESRGIYAADILVLRQDSQSLADSQRDDDDVRRREREISESEGNSMHIRWPTVQLTDKSD